MVPCVGSSVISAISVPGGVLSVLGKYTATGSFVVALAGWKATMKAANHRWDVRLGIRQSVYRDLDSSQRKRIRLSSIRHCKRGARVNCDRQAGNRCERVALIAG